MKKIMKVRLELKRGDVIEEYRYENYSDNKYYLIGFADAILLQRDDVKSVKISIDNGLILTSKRK